jgi:hypothetical protein
MNRANKSSLLEMDAFGGSNRVDVQVDEGLARYLYSMCVYRKPAMIERTPERNRSISTKIECKRLYNFYSPKNTYPSTVWFKALTLYVSLRSMSWL